jgi:hypothetical protein
MGRRGRRPDDLKEKREHQKLKSEALDRTLWRTPLGRGYKLVVILCNERNNKWTVRSLGGKNQTSK